MHEGTSNKDNSNADDNGDTRLSEIPVDEDLKKQTSMNGESSNGKIQNNIVGGGFNLFGLNKLKDSVLSPLQTAIALCMPSSSQSNSNTINSRGAFQSESMMNKKSSKFQRFQTNVIGGNNKNDTNDTNDTNGHDHDDDDETKKGSDVYDMIKPIPKSNVIDSIRRVLLQPTPSLKYINDPKSRKNNVILHDRIYTPNMLPPKDEKLRLKNISNTIDPLKRQKLLEEKIATRWHKGLTWRKVIVNLLPDAHNNIIVRRRFANAYGWPVVDHMVENHFGENSFNGKDLHYYSYNDKRSKKKSTKNLDKDEGEGEGEGEGGDTDDEDVGIIHGENILDVEDEKNSEESSEVLRKVLKDQNDKAKKEYDKIKKLTSRSELSRIKSANEFSNHSYNPRQIQREKDSDKERLNRKSKSSASLNRQYNNKNNINNNSSIGIKRPYTTGDINNSSLRETGNSTAKTLESSYTGASGTTTTTTATGSNTIATDNTTDNNGGSWVNDVCSETYDGPTGVISNMGERVEAMKKTYYDYLEDPNGITSGFISLDMNKGNVNINNNRINEEDKTIPGEDTDNNNDVNMLINSNNLEEVGDTVLLSQYLS
ncbi:unnamed protein product [[Candida] boidinii]|nr:unnamed protein product [[Candida] boidinii]